MLFQAAISGCLIVVRSGESQQNALLSKCGVLNSYMRQKIDQHGGDAAFGQCSRRPNSYAI